MRCYFCGLTATRKLLFVQSRRMAREAMVCIDHAEMILQQDQPRPIGESWSQGPLVQVDVEQLHRVVDGSAASGTEAVILQESGGTRRLRLAIGRCEASTIERLLQPQRSDRPLTPEAFARTLHSLGGKLLHVTITALTRGTYFALLRIDQQGHRFEVDIRPSDGIAFAIVCQAAILVHESLLPTVDPSAGRGP
ncbi:bifunctional nuclease family protein [Tuwongella immobilis]|uniref:BFN domain-containing protein n=1 Tax=Tuwongella immobilis TaxID=692036 RepID=A0A6C2YT20_9BACT|nr:bifunctional nuclease family protein [Tuwongella immobilis]VIP04531.1 hypothetical protein : Marine sediment metagenome DNA, contig: S01H1_S07340 OS=marine sediment metagenome GN=S01H1_35389 PE=4 SV=1: DNase-RNase [Tuwongella immobilis]VTS06423.1 hypothetical protein : Marine sediment metagenome DNA, contig: S01H1_S07340 OS=marine sediment metagenome GN=S01H1_35389 PE=4 SV=1: DNase-RNase [Tuwongella immobilis]